MLFRLKLLFFAFTLSFSPTTADAQNNFVKSYFMKTSTGNQLYNAKVTYGGNIRFGVQPDRSVVTFTVDGHGQPTVDMIASGVMNRVGAALNTKFGSLLPIAPMAQGQTDNLRIRTGDVARWASIGDEAITFAANLATDMWGKQAPGRGLITVATNINLNDAEIKTLIDVFETNVVSDVVEKYLYSILMHEGMHALGLTHSETTGLPQTPVYQFNLASPDHNQIMHRIYEKYDGIDYLEDLHKSLKRAVQEADIGPATGETHTVLDLLNGCFPQMDMKASLNDQCYPDVTKSGIINYINLAMPPIYISLN